MTTISGVWASRWGHFAWRCTADGVCRLQFPEPGRRRTALPDADESVHARGLIAWLEAWLGGAKQLPALPALDLGGGTEFQRAVWDEMLRIPFGGTRTYREMATAIGRPTSVRAVGGACGANPVPLLVPCHRVVAANGGIGGFSAAGGVEIKRRLIMWEQRATRAAAADTTFEY
ncbi:MAG: methylated-DNA--[protein]-cysteine S-methyltransferase [Planctomycetota bacterium]